MDLARTDMNQFARDYLAGRGIDPNTVDERPPYTLADHMLAQAETTLDLILPPRFRTAVPDQPAVTAWVETFLTDSADAPNLLLRGPVGSGKTHQALGALRQVAIEAARRCLRVTYQAITHPEFNAAMRPQPDGTHLSTLVDLQSVDLLVLDDLGAGRATDWTEDTLHRLIDVRWSHQRPTIATTNLDTGTLRAEVDERVVSRLACGVQVALKGTDRRRAGVR